MLSCKQAAELLSAALDRELRLGERLALGLHLALCRDCRNYRRQIGFLRTACRRHPAGEAGCKE
ncbi:MAG: hypothetical protein A2286_05410 [Gammaproteobacteria bacterium RIFOXYA12_FULL_61_12]|nr:MAG: hypothetical protein A2514_06190 [Gammaproteobacteria bacterium RIFOXYD12_FULL_61_37]OGT93982.1 MAG: hypothetical protein A2286_05410 [Gammaproteobacteria bacterium RIFOXYA12_FULL_61_12]